MMLNKQEIKELIEEEDLITNHPHLETQLTPNGFDMTVAKVMKFKGKGKIDFSNSEREIPEAEEVEPVKENEEDKYGWWNLDKGAYKIKTNEKFKIPLGLTGIAFSRSSLLRSGVYTEHGYWDAGFEGKAEFILIVENEKGLKLKENARVAQISFIRMEDAEEGYNGIYHQGD